MLRSHCTEPGQSSASISPARTNSRSAISISPSAAARFWPSPFQGEGPDCSFHLRLSATFVAALVLCGRGHLQPTTASINDLK